MGHIHTMEYYLATKRNGVVIHTAIQVYLKNTMLSEDASHKRWQFRFYEMSQTDRSLETKSRSVIA